MGTIHRWQFEIHTLVTEIHFYILPSLRFRHRFLLFHIAYILYNMILAHLIIDPQIKLMR